MMTKRMVSAIGLLLSLRMVALGAFESNDTGARFSSLSGAAMTANDSVDNLMYNPASLAGIPAHQVSTEWGLYLTAITTILVSRWWVKL